MNKTPIIVLIAFFSVAAICLGVLIALTPDPAPPAQVDIHTKNPLIETLGIDRPVKQNERLIAIKTYQGGVNFEDIRKIAEVGGMEYHELDTRGEDYLLIVPLEINGKMQVAKLELDAYTDEYKVNTDAGWIKCNELKELPNNYSLLLRYSRPDKPEYQIKLVQGEQTATYNIINTEGDSPVKEIQYIIDDIVRDKGQDPTESFGNEIVLDEEE